MIRFTRRLALVALMLIAPLTAQAVGVSIVQVTQVTSSGGDISLLRDGDVLTIDAVLSNPDPLGVAGIGVEVSGYDSDANGIADNGLTLLGGTAADVVFADISVPGSGSIGGLPNIRGVSSGGTVEGGNPFIPAQCNPTICTPVDIPAVELHARVVEAVGTAEAFGTGQNDLGIAGELVSGGDVHIRVQFVATTNGVLTMPTAMTLMFGSSSEWGNDVIDGAGNSLGFMGDSVSFTLAPEPGTAMLFGLGLAGLASVRRR